MDFETILSIAVLVLVGFVFWKMLHTRKESQPEVEFPYRKQDILTNHELSFYKKLKPVADKYGLNVITKIRFADLVGVDTSQTNEYMKFFSKVCSKHIDFGLVNPENMEVMYLIELDDRTHQRQDRIERDKFVNAVCEKTGYILIRTYNNISEVERVLSGE